MKSLAIFISLISFNLFAADVFVVAPFKVESKAANVSDKIKSAINNPEGVLNRYTPIGGAVKNKKVQRNEVTFTMTKKVLIISKTFNVKFIVDIHPVANICPGDEVGYKYLVDLNQSDDLVSDNISQLDFDICLKENSETSVTATVKGKLYKGAGYAEPIGSIARSTIEDQVVPFVDAIKAEVVNSK